MDFGLLAFSGSIDFGFPKGTTFFFSPNGDPVDWEVFDFPSPALGAGPIGLAGDLMSFLSSSESSLSLAESFPSLSFFSSSESSLSLAESFPSLSFLSSSKSSSFFFSSFFGLGCAAISFRALMKERMQSATNMNSKPAEKNMTAGFREEACMIPLGSFFSQFISLTAGQIFLADITKPSNPTVAARCMTCLRKAGLASATSTQAIKTKAMIAGISAVQLFPKVNASPAPGAPSTFIQLVEVRVTGPSPSTAFL